MAIDRRRISASSSDGSARRRRAVTFSERLRPIVRSVGEAQPVGRQTVTQVEGRHVSLASPGTAVALGVVVLALGIVLVALGVLLHKSPGAISLHVAVILLVGAVSVLVAARQPRNPIGWGLLGIAIFLGLYFAAGFYSILDYRMHHGTLPLGLLALVLGQSWAPTLVLVAIVLWLFPDGKLPEGRRRRVFLFVTAIGVAFALMNYAVIGAAAAEYKIHVDASGSLLTPDRAGPWALFVLIENVVFFGLLVSWVLWLILQVPIYRRSTGDRRLQLKWLYCGAAIFVVSLVFLTLLPTNPSSPWQQVVNGVAAVGVAALPISLGIAILRFRLYEIDRVVSRTLAYAIVTGLVVGVYVGMITVVTRVLGFSSPVAVAASTLAAVALFNPLRVRVQRTVDRRFNRAHYDAEATIASFTARLRDAVDLETVRSQLLEVVNRAVEPAHASVWIRQHKSDRGDLRPAGLPPPQRPQLPQRPH